MIVRQNPRRWLAALRWGAAALAVASAHGGVAWYAVHWKPAHAEAAAGAPEPAIMIELSAVSVAPEAPAETLPPAPERVEEEPTPEPAKEPPPPEPIVEPPPPEPIVEPPPPEPPPPEPIPVQTPEPEIKVPELPKIPDALAVLAPPPPPKKIVKPVVRKPPPPKKIVERKPVERPRQREAAAPPPSAAPAAAPTRVTQGAASAPSVSTASWRGSLIAHLNRYKRFPGGARPGTVQVAFSIDRGGRVLSARLVGSSGDSALDEEAVGMIRRASPVPAPPAGVGGGGAVSLAVPVRFSR